MMVRIIFRFSLLIAVLTVVIQTLVVKAADDIFVVEDNEPEIVPHDETTNLTVGYVVLEFGITWNITCTSDQPIIWTYFEASYDWEPNVTTTEIISENAYRPYRSVLHIRNTSAASVGRYYCVNSAAWPERQKILLDALVTENSAVTLYVYVNDTQQNLVPLNGGLTFIVYPHENVSFPCKPSQPGIYPRLCTDDKSNICFNITDPTKGFILHYDEFKPKRLQLFCKFNNSIVYKMYLFRAVRRKLLVSSMKGMENRTIYLESSLTLTCSFLYEWHVPEIRWKVPPYSRHIRKDERIKIRRLDVMKNSTETDEYLATQELFIEKVSYEDDGNYRCEISTDDNFLYDSYNLYVRQSGKDYVKLMEKTKTGIINWKQNDTNIWKPIEISKKEVEAMKEAGLAYFEEGNLDCYNPALALNEQADLLPYNADYEFPIESLVLLEQLGAGAYGVVMKAKAIGIKEHENETTVAVKMLYFGTKNIVATRDHAQGESSQQVYQRKRSDTKNVEHRSSDLQYMEMSGRKNTKASAISMKTSDCVGEYTSMDGRTEDVEPIVPMNKEEPIRSVNTTDLICWAVQVASGMEYLASRNVLHGDLAARNVLVCHDNVVKICDFGLARSMYKCDKYKKKQEALLPFKWLALECISDHVFSTYSDVWAYGVFLWELFSLAKSPYPGMDANEELYNKLLEGYRLEKPRYANQAIYDIMLPCWNETPDSRPSFQELKQQFNAMLPDEIREGPTRLSGSMINVAAEGKPAIYHHPEVPDRFLRPNH
ncbi:hypothetical protein AND_004656 [Anopheles darlingi]|uniref:Receptor protein-tyrosine kinase n=1 Tax=Anopheles darlingi TaxID=43151 RepID=W5JL34_ANODA|nr:hypothetical protein AND_004656 [Anopheles darlingi]